MTGAMIFGLGGQELTKNEIAFFKDIDPWGFILFSRNLDKPAQIKALTDSLRDLLGRDCPILIDQEGGRVARLQPPDFTEWLPPLDQNAKVAPEDARQAMSLRYRIIAKELRDVGVDVNCAPMLDVPQSNTHPIITNRCYGHDVDTISEMGRAVAESLLAGGVLPIIKHIPGHGRGSVDSHLELPKVLADKKLLSDIDFEPFRRLSDLPMAMTAHVVYDA
ncbi:MAG: glycoside hydrolase family 3 N-terminal domain-containing protein, partial [Pseudomonadota bacterium]